MSNEVARTDQQPVGFLDAAAQTFDGALQLAKLMASCGTMPKHLQGKDGDCFRVVVQAAKWKMDPFAVGECTSLVHGRLCFEGKLVAAALKGAYGLDGVLSYDVQGEGQNATIKVSGKQPGSNEIKTVSGSVKKWRTTMKKDGKAIPNAWDNQPEIQLIYRGTRQWARIYAPEVMLGVYTPDEAREMRPEVKEVPVRSFKVETVETSKGEAKALKSPSQDFVDAYKAACKHDGEAVKAMLEEFGVSKPSEADPDLWDEIHERCVAIQEIGK